MEASDAKRHFLLGLNIGVTLSFGLNVALALMHLPRPSEIQFREFLSLYNLIFHFELTLTLKQYELIGCLRKSNNRIQSIPNRLYVRFIKNPFIFIVLPINVTFL